jgi:GNAT superfamily N-acetyltransferase
VGKITELPGARGAAMSRPMRISATHDVSNFDCGKQPLTDWLRFRALKAEARSARTYVVGNETQAVVGYYCLATGAVALSDTPKKFQRNMPDPIPMMVLGRLAVDRSSQGIGIGRGLLKDAFQRTLHASEIVGVAGLIVHAIDDDAVPFYLQYQFALSPLNPRTLIMPVKTMVKLL